MNYSIKDEVAILPYSRSPEFPFEIWSKCVKRGVTAESQNQSIIKQ